jgi:hypothetical protein
MFPIHDEEKKILQQDSSCIDVHFAVVILTPLQAFFYYGFGQ